MRVTNNKGLPGPLVKAIENVTNQYDKGESDLTATGLIEPARIGALKLKYADKIEEDASNLLYSVQGTSIHTILEAAGRELRDEGYIVEERYYVVIDGIKIGAKIDLFHIGKKCLQDYKITSVYSIKDGAKEDYVKQLNIGAYILRQNGFEVESLSAVAILRDWRKGERDRENTESEARGYRGSYPEHQVAVLDVPVIDDAEVLDYMRERIKAHLEARGAKDDSALPDCTPEERWAKPDVYAVMEKGKKRAYRLYDTEEAAMMHVVTLNEKTTPGKYTIKFRPGESTRCKSYCPVAKFCSQYQASLLKGVKDDE